MLDSRSRLRRVTDVASPLRVKSALTVSGTSPGLDDPKGSAFPSLITARECQPSPAGGRRSALARTDPPKRFFLLDRAIAQPLAALPPYAGQPFAASPRYGCRVPLAGRCGIPLAGTAHLSPPKSRRKRRLAPTRVCGRSLFDVSNRGPRRAPRGGERRRSGGSETWPCGPGRTIRSLCRRHGGRRPLPATGKFPAQWGRRIGAGRRRGWIPASNGTHPAHPAWIMPLAGARFPSLHTGKAPGRKARGSPSYETLSSRGRDCSRSCCCSHSRSHCRPSCRCRSSTR